LNRREISSNGRKQRNNFLLRPGDGFGAGLFRDGMNLGNRACRRASGVKGAWFALADGSLRTSLSVGTSIYWYDAPTIADMYGGMSESQMRSTKPVKLTEGFLKDHAEGSKYTSAGVPWSEVPEFARPHVDRRSPRFAKSVRNDRRVC
jgi:hypothetical protein